MFRVRFNTIVVNLATLFGPLGAPCITSKGVWFTRHSLSHAIFAAIMMIATEERDLEEDAFVAQYRI